MSSAIREGILFKRTGSGWSKRYLRLDMLRRSLFISKARRHRRKSKGTVYKLHNLASMEVRESECILILVFQTKSITLRTRSLPDLKFWKENIEQCKILQDEGLPQEEEIYVHPCLEQALRIAPQVTESNKNPSISPPKTDTQLPDTFPRQFISSICVCAANLVVICLNALPCMKVKLHRKEDAQTQVL